MRILIISNFFEPQNNIAVQRIKSLAKYWSIEDDEVTVLTTRKIKKFDGFIEDYKNNETRFKVIEAKYLPKLLDKKIQNPSNIRIPIRQKKNILSKIKNNLPVFIDLRFLWIFTGFFSGITSHRKNNYDVIVASYPLFLSFIIGYLLSVFTKKPLILDYRDLCSSDTSYVKNKNKFINKVNYTIERFIIKKALLVVVVSEGNKNLQDKFFKINSIVIENGFDSTDSIFFKNIKKNDGYIKNISYLGKIIPPFTTPEILFKALQRIKSKTNIINFKINFYTPNMYIISELARKYGIEEFINVYSPIPREESLKIQAESDYLLFLDWNDPEQTGVLSGKIFEYINSGTPIISIGGYPTSSASKLITENGFGVAAYQDTISIKNILENILSNSFTINSVKNQDIIDKYDRKNLALKYKNVILESLNFKK